MHRMPLGIAILIDIFMIMLAIQGNTAEYTINQQAIWTIICINSLFITISIIKRTD